jgi:general stress protein 26
MLVRAAGYARDVTVKTNEEPRPLAEAIEGLRVAMVAIPSGEGIISRPLTLLEHEGSVLRFLVARSAPWVSGLPPEFPANAAFADGSRAQYAAVEGKARVTSDRALIEQLWNPAAKVYFDGPDDPDVAVLELHATGGEYWDGPDTKAGQAIAMALTAVRHETTLEDHGDIEVDS